MPDGIGISSYLMRQQNGLSLKTQHNSKVWTIVPLEPPKPLAPGSRRVSQLAAGGVCLRDTSTLLFERDAYSSSGGRAIARVQSAPEGRLRQGYRCAAPASSPPGPRGKRLGRRFYEDQCYSAPLHSKPIKKTPTCQNRWGFIS